MFYQKIVLHGNDETHEFLECLRQRPMHTDFAGKYISSLYLGGTPDELMLIDILSLYSDIRCLALLVPMDASTMSQLSLWHALNRLKLKTFTVGMAIDYISISTCDVFKNLTHLDIMDRSLLKKSNTGLDSLHTLTHICLVLAPHKCNPHAIVPLICNAHLQVLAFRVEHSHRVIERFLEQHGMLDRQIVLFPSQIVQWDELGRGDMLMWELTEEKIRLPIPEHIMSSIADFSIRSS